MDTEFNLKNNDKKRLLIIITQSEFGGAQRFIFNLVNKLKSDPNYEIKICVGADGGGEFTKTIQEIEVPITTLPSLKRNLSFFNDVVAYFNIRKEIKSFNPDVLFLNSSKAGFLGAFSFVFPFRVCRARVIYRIGGWTFNDPWLAWEKRMWIILEKISARWKDVIIVNSRKDEEQAKFLGICPRDKIVVVHNGLDVYKVNSLARDEARLRIFEKLSRQSGKVFQAETIVGTVSNLYPAKALENFVLAAVPFRDDSSVIFVIIGEGAERPKLEALIREQGLEKNVFLLGQIASGSRFVTAFDIYIQSSVKEGFSWSLLEAMASKVPVIATDVGATSEIIENGKNGLLVDAGHPNQISASIAKLIKDDRLRSEFAIQGHQTVLFKFSLDRMIDQIESLL
ncbi:MAG: putative membrane protein [Candidatus Yanofskybacteria bacterium GW2011_GWD2_39_48]|uniref:Putative membrane protein n=1 Tax=Candidatus Yanofskybacteria bacterium GW2011_GWD2_39_48 TaxID=1619031 RepID=A0A0G0PE65_9BACT|nr:MAG: putative membrane protein [Candidatus Yanofskybacteria bacterium GW2011_GWD2_39_48]